MNAATYVNAPATALVATHCCACGRPLLDARSVECGMGPTCREKHGFGEAEGPADWRAVLSVLDGLVSVEDIVAWQSAPDGARHAANVLVHRIAARPSDGEVSSLVSAVSALGFGRCAAAIASHLLGAVRVDVVVEGDALAVRVDGRMSDETFGAWTAMLRTIRGRRWDGERKANVMPVSAKRDLWTGLKRVLPRGSVVVGARMAVV